MKRLLAVLCMMLFFTVHAEDTLLYMVNVGKGDAIIIRTQGKNYLVDAGKSDAWEAVEAALARLDITELDGVFMTHTDKDHSGGLKKLVKSGIEVKAWYAAGLCPEEREDNPIVKAAKKQDASVTWLYAGDCVDGLFTVLAPTSTDVLNEDNNSLVMMFLAPEGYRMLLTGDMEWREEIELVESTGDFSCDVFKVPNHADNDVCLAGLTELTGAEYALISTDPYDKPGTPDEFLLSRLEDLGMEVYRTDMSENGIMVRMSEERIIVTYE